MQFILHKELWNILIYLPFSTWCGKFLAASSLFSVSICVVVAPLVFLGTGGGFESPPLAGTGGGTAGPPPMTVVPPPTTTTSSYDCVALCFGTMILISAYCTVASDCGGFAIPPLGTCPKSEYIGSLPAPVAPVVPIAPVELVGLVGLVGIVDCSTFDDCSVEEWLLILI